MDRRKRNGKKRNASARNTTKQIGLLGQALRGLGGLGGAALGGLAGHPGIGGAVGTSFGAAISKWLGAGDYQVSKNSLVTRASASIPTMHRTDQTVVIRHREYIGPLTGSTEFTVQRQLIINPGLSGTFPWLSGIAKNFQEYRVTGMVYHYVPTSGSAISSTSSALGSVMFQTTYRTTDDEPSSKVEMLNEYWSNEVVPFESTVHPIECDPKENPFSVHYVRVGDAVGEPLLYDIGKTFIATQGMQSAYTVGDVWVTYEVELKKPIVTSNVTSMGAFKSAAFGGAAVTTASFFNDPGQTYGQLPVTISSGRTITFATGLTGTYILTLHIQSPGGLGHATQVTFIGTAALTNCAFADLSFGGNTETGSVFNTATTGTALDLYYTVCLVITNPGVQATMRFPDGQWTSGAVGGVGLNIVQIDS
jgi:hypothetical protein